MTSFKDPSKRRELIMKHYSSPKYKNKLKKADIDLYSNNCVDEIHIKLDIEDEIIKNAVYDAEGCAIFISSSDIMIGKIIGQTKEKVKELINAYEEMIINGKTDKEELLQELLIYENVASHLNRLHCAEMISNALKKLL